MLSRAGCAKGVGSTIRGHSVNMHPSPRYHLLTHLSTIKLSRVTYYCSNRWTRPKRKELRLLNLMKAQLHG
ncbi:hypothetical protein ASPVEDRAFT_830795 [Aspergillus versicolor CBS 583.65]|uniref:Uncharacterized protein n=1 Tax=Aspergillus versicolor CBS 583.65 TaxID=1036611 RepID=A0A1L9PU17_ASPVE|nr:uncharacterized protein ASPVEDRAFT_830795 [Aspergillus versicolor CBS 583.65]OJJ05037.1 hypothetical protein ASPVEDRAFT_830795 [Aspergillus versicolor CBS 583.65]